MKKILLSLSLVASLFAADKLLNPKEALEIAKHSPFYNQIQSKLKAGLKIKGMEKDDFYIITIYDDNGAGNFFVTKDLKYTILGNVFDNKKQQLIKANYPAEPFSGDPKVVKDGVLFSFGSGKEDLYVVTDPECPFCQKFEKEAKNTNFAKKYRIHIIFLPLPFHKNSKDMIYYILSAKTEAQKAQRFHEVLQGSDAWKNFKPTPAQKAKIDAELQKSIKAVKALKAKGTPSVYDANFTQKSWSTLVK